MRPEALDREAERLSERLPDGRKLGVLGSTSFWHANTEDFCEELGAELAKLQALVVVTGGMPGVAATVANAFFQACLSTNGGSEVVHVLPFGHHAPEIGSTHYAGSSLSHRRELLARLAMVYLVVEGGPGTADEVAIARHRGARIIPVACLGGAAGAVYSLNGKPDWAPLHEWQELCASSSEPSKLARTVAYLAALALDAQVGA